MSELDLIRQLGDHLGRPLEQIPEERFEQHVQAKYARGSEKQNQIDRDAYSLTAGGSVSGLLLKPVTRKILFDFPLHQFSRIRHLHLNTVNLPNLSFLAGLTGLHLA